MKSLSSILDKKHLLGAEPPQFKMKLLLDIYENYGIEINSRDLEMTVITNEKSGQLFVKYIPTQSLIYKLSSEHPEVLI